MLRRALRDFKVKKNEGRKIKYCVCRNIYEKILEHKRKVCQAKEVEHINTGVRQKISRKVGRRLGILSKRGNLLIRLNQKNG
jgi:tetrahydromethanopterin S-methyltransferase subunit G